ncbi:hypothetical protein LK533_11340 [Sphingomonas sp. PL-96]|uniref:hypothetical protein n=1 Tax=Sphingomonas sp. PL-96 TaxID=2887201 RepID=UPI001E2AA0D1|nr:hypothetical protein [Sphingomonas sp. PL-96]MCC2977264.1 hypothetical protein [Sphingomonas sp. PL-96]
MKRGLADRVRALRVTLWTLIVPPALWAAHFLFSYIWAAVTCAKTGSFAKYPVLFIVCTAIALALIAAAGIVAHIQSATPGDPPPHEGGTDSDRIRFLAKATLLLSGLSFAGVVFTAVPVIFLQDCR